MDVLKRWVVGAARGLLIGWYALCCCLPRKRRIVCFSRQSDCDPIDFLLLKRQIECDRPDYEVVILAKAIGNKLAYAAHMFKQVYYLATSRAAVLDSYCIVVSLLDPHLKIPVLQMWHALGMMKQAGYAALGDAEGRNPETAHLFRMHKGYNSVLVSSASFTNDFAATFNVDPSIVYEAPLPRVDLLIDETERSRRRAQIEEAFPRLRERETVVYCPTFRKNVGQKDVQAVENLIDEVTARGLNFVYKPHPVSTLTIDDARMVQDASGRYDMLFAADYVITDYSTIMYEAGLLGVPVFLYGYDWEDYRTKRSLGINLEADVPLLMSADPERIADAVCDREFDADAFGRFVAEYIAVPTDSSCTERIEKHLLALMGEGKSV